ncbi:MAG: twin-arginine translocase TatA/TatE family subunit [Anaerolineae bacterium]|nr:twin-arginine translocase TatA/TatE family subunit [Anaerolineae bacterium]
MPNFGVWEWLVILVIVLVIFGASRLKDIGSGLGGAINAFRREVKTGREEEGQDTTPATPAKVKEAPKPQEEEESS